MVINKSKIIITKYINGEVVNYLSYLLRNKRIVRRTKNKSVRNFINDVYNCRITVNPESNIENILDTIRLGLRDFMDEIYNKLKQNSSKMLSFNVLTDLPRYISSVEISIDKKVSSRTVFVGEINGMMGFVVDFSYNLVDK